MNNPSQLTHRQRSQYLRSIQADLLEDILANHHQEQLDTLEGLIRENTYLLGQVKPTTFSFMYAGEFYRSANSARSREDNRAIHPSMMSRIIEFVQDKDFNFATQKSQVENYVANALTFSKHKNDLIELIPGRFHTILNQINEDWFNIGPAANSEAIEQFKKLNRKGLVEFQRLFLENLLLH